MTQQQSITTSIEWFNSSNNIGLNHFSPSFTLCGIDCRLLARESPAQSSALSKNIEVSSSSSLSSSISSSITSSLSSPLRLLLSGQSPNQRESHNRKRSGSWSPLGARSPSTTLSSSSNINASSSYVSVFLDFVATSANLAKIRNFKIEMSRINPEIATVFPNSSSSSSSNGCSNSPAPCMFHDARVYFSPSYLIENGYRRLTSSSSSSSLITSSSSSPLALPTVNGKDQPGLVGFIVTLTCDEVSRTIKVDIDCCVPSLDACSPINHTIGIAAAMDNNEDNTDNDDDVGIDFDGIVIEDNRSPIGRPFPIAKSDRLDPIQTVAESGLTMLIHYLGAQAHPVNAFGTDSGLIVSIPIRTEIQQSEHHQIHPSHSHEHHKAHHNRYGHGHGHGHSFSHSNYPANHQARAALHPPLHPTTHLIINTGSSHSPLIGLDQDHRSDTGSPVRFTNHLIGEDIIESRSRTSSISPSTLKDSESRPQSRSALSEPQWQHRLTKKDIKVSSAVIPGSTWQMVRAVGIVPVDRKTLCDLLINDELLPIIDDMIECIEPILRLDTRVAVRRMKAKGVWPTDPRDFVVCTTWSELSDGSIVIVSKSAPADYYPEKPGCVRGSVIVSGYWIQPLCALPQTDSDYSIASDSFQRCRLTLLAHTELGGSLPCSVINLLSVNAPLKIIQTIAKYFGS